MPYIVTDDDFLLVEITDDMRERAQSKADEMGALRNSIRKGKGNLAGFLGEEVVLAAWDCATSDNTYQHDVTFEGITFEVKTKDRTVPPQLTYEASVANYNARQNANFYVFVSLLRNKASGLYTHGYIIGIMDKKEYIARSTFLKVGDIDPSNGWRVSADCYNLPYHALARFGAWRPVEAAVA